MNLSKSKRNHAFLESYFNTSQRATAATLLIFTVFIFAYLMFQVGEGATEDRCVEAHQLGELTPCADQTPVIEFHEDGLLEYSIRKTVLEKYYDSQNVAVFLQEFEDEVAEQRQTLLDKRAYYFNKARSIISDKYDDKLPIEIPIVTADSSDVRKKIFADVNLEAFSKKLESLASEVKFCSDSDCKEVFVSQLKDIATECLALQQREGVAKQLLQDKVEGLKPQLNFLWLYHPGAGWIIELVFWSLFGLCCCTLVNNNQFVREGSYQAKLYILFFPRLLLAPVMSVVVVALISSGYMEYNSNLNNFPYFLALAFFLGFNSESLNALIRDASNKILQPLSFSTEKMLKANKKTPYQPRKKPDGSLEQGPPSGTGDIRKRGKNILRSEAEKLTVRATINGVKK